MIDNIKDTRDRIKVMLDNCYNFKILDLIEFILANNDKDVENRD